MPEALQAHAGIASDQVSEQGEVWVIEYRSVRVNLQRSYVGNWQPTISMVLGPTRAINQRFAEDLVGRKSTGIQNRIRKWLGFRFCEYRAARYINEELR